MGSISSNGGLPIGYRPGSWPAKHFTRPLRSILNSPAARAGGSQDDSRWCNHRIRDHPPRSSRRAPEGAREAFDGRWAFVPFSRPSRAQRRVGGKWPAGPVVAPPANVFRASGSGCQVDVIASSSVDFLVSVGPVMSPPPCSTPPACTLLGEFLFRRLQSRKKLTDNDLSRRVPVRLPRAFLVLAKTRFTKWVDVEKTQE